METTVQLYSYSFKTAKTYLFATLFIAGNLLLPQLAHFIPNGGATFLPIYFFTLIAAYKYGFHVGLLTAVLSPIVNSLLFGMPLMAMLPVILTKSVLLAAAASYAAYRFKNISLISLLLVILSYQVVGSLVEWAIVQNFYAALQDFRIGFPGMLIQLFLGYGVLKFISKY